MAHHAAVHCSENRFQCAVLLYNFFLIGTFTRNINTYANRAHNAPVQIVQRGFIGRQKHRALFCLHDFLRNARFHPAHDLPLGFNARRVVMLYIPDIRMPAPFDLPFRFMDRLTETVIHFFMYSVLILKPDKVWHTVYSCLQIVACLPCIFFPLASLLPAQETESHFFL